MGTRSRPVPAVPAAMNPSDWLLLCRTVRFGGGGEVAYDFLILATGSKTRRLAVPGVLGLD